jgi:hypothetical protein
MEDIILLTPKFLKILKCGSVVIPLTSKAIKYVVDYFYVPKAKDI